MLFGATCQLSLKLYYAVRCDFLQILFPSNFSRMIRPCAVKYSLRSSTACPPEKNSLVNFSILNTWLTVGFKEDESLNFYAVVFGFCTVNYLLMRFSVEA